MIKRVERYMIDGIRKNLRDCRKAIGGGGGVSDYIVILMSWFGP